MDASGASCSSAADPINSSSYGVFINHRGPDTKKTFATPLYRRLFERGLKPFLDQEELKVGFNFPSQILGAIRSARVHVAIFSPTYAHSQWCLDELSLMLESGAPIIPIFFQVDPADLRWTDQKKKGVYAEALNELQTKTRDDLQTDEKKPRYDSATLQKWRKALSDVADISGFDLKGKFNGDEDLLLDEVVKRVVELWWNPAGLDDKIEDFETTVLAQQHTGEVQVVGVVGLGGDGKTTFYQSKQFNRNSSKYSKSYFLSDVRENARISLHSLQSKLLKGLFGDDRQIDNIHEGHGQVEEDTLIDQDRQIVFTMDTLIIVFTMDTLIAATENFHENNKIGEGGFGAVYKGTTENGKEIAVKKLSLQSLQGKKEFLNEIKLVTKIQHRNIVNLLGCCAEGSERLLVYEYLPNNSLDKILFDPNKRKQLDWQKRYNIIVGVARGLLYLHEDSQLRIIHRDIKASNILLDGNLNAKIADFGLARLFPEDQTHVSTRVAGTYGYMAPEYAMHGQLSVKADVYSFGVLLLELITGRKNTNFNLSLEMQLLLAWAWRLYRRGNIVEMIDPAIIVTCNVEEALRCIHVGLLCTQADSSLRPSMSLITLMLSSHSVTLPDPTQPAFVSACVSENSKATDCGSGVSQSASISSASSASFHAPLSNADASITDLVPR